MWPSAASADWREDIGTFRIGIVAEPGGGNTVPGLARLTEAYTNALGMKVEFFVARDYAALIEAQTAGRIEYAVYSATAYAVAAKRCGCVEPLVAPLDEDGAAGIRSVLLTRGDKVPDVASLGRHTIASPPAGNVAGFLLPAAELAAKGISLRPGSPFLKQADSALGAEAMLIDGSADAVFGWEGVTRDGEAIEADGTEARLVAAGVPQSELKAVWTSATLRYGPHAVRADLDPEAKRRLAVFLTNLKSNTPDVYDLLEKNHSGGFAKTEAADYAAAEAMVAAASASAK